MWNLLIAFAMGLLVTVLVRLAHLPLYAGVVPGVLAMLGTFVVLARRVAKKIKALVAQAQKDLSTQPTSQRDRDQRVEKAVKTLESGLVYDRWQLLVGSELHAQIGMIRYMVKDLPAAERHLKQANPRNAIAMAMLGALNFQRKDTAPMKESFETAVNNGKKEGLVWAVYAWCLLQLKDREGAMSVMSRAVAANPGDDKLKAGLSAIQNDKRLKMKPYEPMWWQFGLEAPPAELGGGRRVQFQRR